MSQLFETIKCENGKLINLEFHQERFTRSRKTNFGGNDTLLLKENIAIPAACQTGTFSCRVTYSNQIEKIEFLPYHFRKVESLKLVYDETVDYSFKYANREYLSSLFEKRENCDDILIVKNGCISDSYTANAIFFDSEKWWTPDTPLLPGTQRTRLVNENIIRECRITPDDLTKFSKAGLINAFQSMENMPVIEIKNILR